jgi:protein-S-isoprenylcysteine O-methyltransferase Ste14
MKTYTAIYAIPEMIIVLIGVACIVWLVWTVREHKQAIAKDVLDQAWREVLNDPHYMERRHFEERKRVEDCDHRHPAVAKS